MKEYLGKKILWVFEHKKARLWQEQIRCARVMELSPSGTYARLIEGSYSNWYISNSIHVLEVLEEKVSDERIYSPNEKI